MVYPLIWFHPVESITLDGAIRPEYIPIFIFLVGKLNLVSFSDGPHDWIVAVADVDVQAIVIFELVLVLPLFLILVILAPSAVNRHISLDWLTFFCRIGTGLVFR